MDKTTLFPNEGSPLSVTEVQNLSREILQPEYEIERFLHAGQNTCIFEAIETRLKRRVAIKVLRPDCASDPLRVEEFLREARTTARLEQQPHVIRLLNVSEKSGLRFLTMTYVPGENLRQRLSRVEKLAPVEAIPLIRQLLEALRAVHAAGLLHLDLRPENILLEEQQLTLIGFSNARMLGANRTGVDSPRSTMPAREGYMSPELLTGKAVDERSDLYSVGAILFEMLSGTFPSFPSARSEGVPEELNALCRQLMQPDPEKRLGSAPAVMQALKEASPVRWAKAVAVPRVRKAPDPTMVTTAEGKRMPDGRGEPSLATTAEGPAALPQGNVRSLSFLGEPWIKWAVVLLLAVGGGIGLFKIFNATLGPPAGRQATTDVPPSSVPDAVASVATPSTTTAAVAPPLTVSEPTLPPVPPPTVFSSRTSPARESGQKANRPALPPATLPIPVAAGTAPAKELVEESSAAAQRLTEGSSKPLRNEVSATETAKRGPSAIFQIPHTFEVLHDHVSGNCQGRLTFLSNSLEFISEKEKDSRQWEYSQVRKATRKGTSRLEISTSERDIKKLGFTNRNYRFDFPNNDLSGEVLEFLLSRIGHN